MGEGYKKSSFVAGHALVGWDGSNWGILVVPVRSCLAIMGFAHSFTQPTALVIHVGIQTAMLETASHLIIILSFKCCNSSEGKESQQNLGPQNLRDCRSQHLKAALPLVVASSSFWSLWSHQGWREKVLCCFFKKKHASVIFAAEFLMAEN